MALNRRTSLQRKRHGPPGARRSATWEKFASGDAQCSTRPAHCPLEPTGCGTTDPTSPRRCDVAMGRAWLTCSIPSARTSVRRSAPGDRITEGRRAKEGGRVCGRGTGWQAQGIRHRPKEHLLLLSNYCTCMNPCREEMVQRRSCVS